MMNSHSESRFQKENKPVNAPECEAVRKRGFLRLPQVLEILPISKSTWWKGIKEGRFPKPVKLTERTSAWPLEDIEALCDKLISPGEERANEGKCV
jgi:predicted DNA-binding transcriptional regulator AlpA